MFDAHDSGWSRSGPSRVQQGTRLSVHQIGQRHQLAVDVLSRSCPDVVELEMDAVRVETDLFQVTAEHLVA